MSSGNLTFRHESILASAGTGKTYQLSNRYLALVARHHRADQILAATFARKAAGEILDRIFMRLAVAAVAPEPLRELANAIGLSTFDSTDAIRLLRLLTQHLHRLRVGTLDSFFVQIAGCFSLEIGLPPGWRIIEDPDDQQLRLKSIQAVLSKGMTADALELVRLLSKGKATRSITDELWETVNELYDVYCETSAEAWSALGRPPVLDAEALEQALEHLPSLTLPNRRFANAHSRDLENSQKRDWEAFISTGLSKVLAGGGSTYYGKPIDRDVQDAYSPLIVHATGVLITDLANQTEGTRDLFGAIRSRISAAETGAPGGAV